MRTFSRADWQQAAAAWTAGEFGPDWTAVRELAARHGILYPPNGTRWDDVKEDPPSQRAIVALALRDTPALLATCVAASSSWAEVVEAVTATWKARRSEVAAAEVRPAQAGGVADDRRTPPARLGELLEALGVSGGPRGGPPVTASAPR